MAEASRLKLDYNTANILVCSYDEQLSIAKPLKLATSNNWLFIVMLVDVQNTILNMAFNNLVRAATVQHEKESKVDSV